MKLIIAGSRHLELNYDFLEGLKDFVGESGNPIYEVISGGCPTGIDKLAKDYFDCETFEGVVNYKEFPADWNKYGKSAGPIRNKQMAEYGDALLLIWDGESNGSKNMKKEMLKFNKPIYEVILKKYNG